MPEQKYKTVTKLSKDGKRFIKVKVPVNTKKTTKKIVQTIEELLLKLSLVKMEKDL